MRIVILCKRRPQNKDLWVIPHGRFFHLAKYLAQAGHEVELVLLNYRREPEFSSERDGFVWHSVNLLPNPASIYLLVRRLVHLRKADWFIGFSDTWFGILAVVLAKKYKAKVLVDAYDNYESYMPWCKPLHWLWRWALCQANALTAPGRYLLTKMIGNHREPLLSAVIPMAADARFVPADKDAARRELDLPIDKKLIGYCGSAHSTRDMTTFFNAIRLLASRHPEYAFVMTGRVYSDMTLPQQVIHLGYLSEEKMPIMINALDVMVSVNRPSDFGSYSYPVKLYEAMACGIPVVASETPSVAEVLGKNNDALVPPEDASALAGRLEEILDTPHFVKPPRHEGWAVIAARLETLLRQGVSQ